MRFGSPRSARRGLASATVLSALVAATTLGSASLAPRSASADPIDDRIRAAAAQLDALNTRVDVAVEQYNEAQLALAAATRTSAASQAKVAAAQETVGELRGQLGKIAAAAYRTGGTDDVITLVLTSDAQSFLAKAGLLDQLSRNQADTLQAVSVASHQLSEQKAAADRAVATQKTVAATMAATKASIEADLASQASLLNSLKGEKARLDRIRAEQAAAAQRAAAASAAAAARASQASTVSRSTRSTTSTSSGAAASSPNLPPSSDRAGTAVAWAKQKLGSPYQWAAAGPDRFDCSGLTMYVWGKAGVGLPHSSKAQYNSGPHVSQSQLAPGDLVFYGSPIHHVGIYIGGGQMISAPHTGDVVKVQNAFRSDYVGAVRPG